MSVKKVALVGANGSLGSVMLLALAAADFEVTVLVRSSSSSKLPSSVAHLPNVTTKAVDPDFAIPSLTESLRGQDAVVAAFPLPGRMQQHLRLVYAAAAAGVRRFIPADYGSCDSANPEALKRLQLYRDKTKVRERCQELTREFPETFTWTALVCGHFFDWGLRRGFLHFFLDRREAMLLDGGELRSSLSTLSRVAESIVRILQRPEETANRTLYVQSFCITQRQLLAAVEKATTGPGTWTVHDEPSAEVLERSQREVEEAGGKHTDASETIVHVLGTLHSDWTKEEAFAMDLLSLEDEDLDEAVQKVVEEEKARNGSTWSWSKHLPKALDAAAGKALNAAGIR